MIAFFCYTSIPGKVFKFKKSSEEGLAYAVPESSELPSSFILCTSHRETRMMGDSFLTFYGDDGKPWITLSIWPSKGKIFLWTRVGTTWKRIMVIKRHWWNFWIHICINADTVAGKIIVSVNGVLPVTIVTKELIENVPSQTKSKLFLGLSEWNSEGKTQFIGDITNIRLFKADISKDLAKITQNLCELQDGLIINIETFGNVDIEEEEDWKVCNQNETYKVAVAASMSWKDSMFICSNLGHGNMTELTNEEEVKYIASLFNIEKDSCENVWTPITDVDEEGKYRNAVTGELSSFLPWETSEPNGEIDENFVILRLSSLKYFDNIPTIIKPVCTICEVDVHTTFYLRGLCQESYFGDDSSQFI